jgi:hypothetical protein
VYQHLPALPQSKERRLEFLAYIRQHGSLKGYTDEDFLAYLRQHGSLKGYTDEDGSAMSTMEPGSSFPLPGSVPPSMAWSARVGITFWSVALDIRLLTCWASTLAISDRWSVRRYRCRVWIGHGAPQPGEAFQEQPQDILHAH